MIRNLVRCGLLQRKNVQIDIRTICCIPKEQYIEAVRLTLGTNYFQYEGKIYQQIDGIAMKGPISSVIAQLTMEYLEETVIINMHHHILFHKRFFSNIPRKQIRNPNDFKFLPKAEFAPFLAYFPKIVEDVTDKKVLCEIAPVNERLGRFLNYYGPYGKFIRQHFLIYVYKLIEKHFGTFDSKNMEQVYQMGWCLEMHNCQFMLVDDLLDDHEIRRGKKTWQKIDNNGLNSILDSYLVQAGLFHLLKKYFSGHQNYVQILENFSRLTLVSGMSLDMITTNFEDFTLERHMQMGVSKTADFAMKQPFELVTLLTNKGYYMNDLLKNVFDLFGYLYNVQNDMLDCYGEELMGKPGTDIREKRCTAPIVLAFKKASEQQRKQLEECFGVDNEIKIQKVKKIYEDLDILGEYYKLEKDIHNKIAREIENISDEFTRSFIEDLAFIYTYGEVGKPRS